MNMKSLFRLIPVALCMSYVSISSAASQGRLVAECVDKVSTVGYRVFQADATGLNFSAENMNSGVKIKNVVMLIPMNERTILWSSTMASKRQFQLLVNRKDVNQDGTDAVLTTKEYQGHVRCSKIFPPSAE